MKSLNPAAIAPPFARYSHGVELPPNARILRSSGQLGLTSDGSVPESSHGQAEVCFNNIRAILKEGDMGPEDVFHLSAFVTNRAHMKGYMEARDAFLADIPASRLPSSTLLIVSGFTREEFKVEIEVWAAKA